MFNANFAIVHYFIASFSVARIRNVVVNLLLSFYYAIITHFILKVKHKIYGVTTRVTIPLLIGNNKF